MLLGFCFLALAGSALAGSSVEANEAAAVTVGSSTMRPHPARNGTAAVAPYGKDDKVQLKLCECERATGPPDGLSCDKEGWFISSFERQGQWVAGGGYVPLSHAICCRPCLPEELPTDPSGRIPGGQAPLAVISLGCHASTDSISARCEYNAGSFVAGYSEAVKVFTTPDTFYPINTVQCCTPALLLENGDAWELERCGCHDSPDTAFPVSCGGTNTDELLMGFIFYRMSPLGHVVPVGPAQCCKTCLSGTVHPMNQCDDLNSCSGRGVCNMRRCECFEGWTGPDCSQAAHNGKSVPPWAIALIVLSSGALAGIFIVAAGFALQALGVATNTPAGSEDGDADARQPLLIRIDADDAGSVGSADTTDCEDEVTVEEVERRLHNAIQRLETAAAAADPGGRSRADAAAHAMTAPAAAASTMESPSAGAATEAGSSEGDIVPEAAAPEQQEAGTGVPSAAEASADGQAAGPTAAEEEGGEAAVQEEQDGDGEAAATTAAGAAAAAAAASDGAEAAEPQKHGSCGPVPEGPLAMIDCSVCMSRPVQVVVVPCGHVCLCRRCSRRLKSCPMCRKEIARRQRLFV